MNEQLHSALAELEDTLSEINNWSQIIKESETTATAAIAQASQNLQQAHELVSQLKTSSEQTQGVLQTTAQKIQSSTEEVFQLYRDLAAVTAELVEYLRSVNFPARLDKMDTSISSISQGLQNLSDKQDRHKDKLEEKIEKESQDTRQKMEGLFVEFSKKAAQENERLQKELRELRHRQQLNFWIQTALLILVLVGLSYSLISQ